MPTYCGVEGGGTTWRVAIAKDDPTNIVEMEVFDTLDNAAEQLSIIRSWLDKRKFDALGIATFGPIDPKISSKTYGFITSTPKKGWKNIDVVGALSDGSVPVKFDTDVNAPALAEYMFGKKSKETESSCAYITVGTGIGVGLVVNGKTVHGLLHPEAGHVCCQRLDGDTYKGNDELFGASIEGLASAPALADRKKCKNKDLATLSDDDSIWKPCAHALASLCATLVLVASPEKIILSGGVLNRKCLYPMVRQYTLELLHGYIIHPKLTEKGIGEYITPSTFDQKAGIVGSLTLAYTALNETENETDIPLLSKSTTCKGPCSKCYLSGAALVALTVAATIGVIATGKWTKKG